MRWKTDNRLLRLGCGCVVITAICLLQCLPRPIARQSAGILLETAEAREAYLLRYGWVTTLYAVSDTRMPMTWQTDTGRCWLSLQQAQGFHPEAYAGAAVQRFIYQIAEMNTGDWYAELWLCEDTLVGAQIYNRADPASMQGVR